MYYTQTVGEELGDGRDPGESTEIPCEGEHIAPESVGDEERGEGLRVGGGEGGGEGVEPLFSDCFCVEGGGDGRDTESVEGGERSVWDGVVGGHLV